MRSIIIIHNGNNAAGSGVYLFYPGEKGNVQNPSFNSYIAFGFVLVQEGRGVSSAMRGPACSAILKTLDTSSHLLYLNICKITNLWKFELVVVEVSCEIIMKERPCHMKLCAFRCFFDETSDSKFEVLKSNLLKTTLLQRELFLTMFYLINSSPLLVTK